MKAVLIPVSVGELYDKITILQIKAERITDHAKLANVKKELAALSAIAPVLDVKAESIVADLADVNGKLWLVENELRALDALHDFGLRFVELAKSVYLYNDRRSALKQQLNVLTDSELVEEKSYI